jgi:hypothetical protein
MRPVLLLDVDGPLNPWAAKPWRRPEGYETHRMRPPGRENEKKPLRVWLNPGHGPALLALPFDLAWCTGWLSSANRWIAPCIGLPGLPHVPLDELPLATKGSPLCWKTPAVALWAQEQRRPFAWVDDEITDADREYMTAMRSGPALLLAISPRLGLRSDDFAELSEWASALPLEPGAT